MIGAIAAPHILAAGLIALSAVLLRLGLMRALSHRSRSRRLAEVVHFVDETAAPAAHGEHRSYERFKRAWLATRAYVNHRTTLFVRVTTIAALASAVIGLVGGRPTWFVLVALMVAINLWVRREAGTRRRLEEQAAPAFEMLANGLRAGFSVPQAIGLVAREIPEPTASEFALVEREIALGSSLADALTHLAQRTHLPDYDLVSTVIWIQSEVGGNLPVVLDSVVATVRERFGMREQVLALTAQQRLASIVLTLLPVVILLLLLSVDRTFVEPMFSLLPGRVMLALAALLVTFGWFALRAVGRVEF
jgi:tight adherence protein B